MNLVFLLVAVSIGGAFAVAALARFRTLACGLDAALMTTVTVAVVAAAFLPGWMFETFGSVAAWPESGPSPTLKIAAAAAIVASIFSVRTAIVGEANLLFGAIGVWGHVALIATLPGIVQTFLVLQMATWLAWVEVSRRDQSSKTLAGTRWLLWTVAADLPLAFAVVSLLRRSNDLPWAALESYARAAAENLDDPLLSLFVLGLVCSSAVRLAQFPLSTWLPGVVETSRVGRGFALGLLAIPIGLILLEHAAGLWLVSPEARLIAQAWAPLAVIAAAVVTFGQQRPNARLAVAVASMLGVVTATSAMAGPVSWAAMLTTVAAIRPAWGMSGRVTCGVAFTLLFANATAPTAALLAATESVGKVSAVFEAACLLALVAAGRATGGNRFSDELSDEVTHPRWPSVLLLLLTAGLLWDDGGPGVLRLVASLGVDRLVAAAAAFGVGLISVRMYSGTGDGDQVPTIIRLARRQFYIDDVVSFAVVLTTRAAAQAVRLFDWSATRTGILSLTSGVMRRLDADSRAAEQSPTSVVTGAVVVLIAITVVVLTGVS